jgi:hypothetical protein
MHSQTHFSFATLSYSAQYFKHSPMDRWDPIELTSTFRPVLEPQEAIQTTQDQVGLYDG